MSYSIKMGWFVLSKYYGLSDISPVYAAAILLHPSKRRRYIKRQWEKDWQQPVINTVEKLWMDNYKGRSMELSISEIRIQTSATISTELDKLRAELDVIDNNTGGIDDDLHHFINDRPIRITSTPLEWWCTTAQIRRYPRFFRMAIDILSIPPMSDETERVFSGARRSIIWGRARLGPETIDVTDLETLGQEP
jgi:hypothetical protein